MFGGDASLITTSSTVKLRILDAATMESVKMIFFGDDLYFSTTKPIATHASSNAQTSSVLASPHRPRLFSSRPER
jgi:hypothetical protein